MYIVLSALDSEASHRSTQNDGVFGLSKHHSWLVPFADEWINSE